MGTMAYVLFWVLHSYHQQKPSTLNPKSLNPKTLNPSTLNPKALNPKP